VVDEEPGQVVGEFAGRPAGGVDTAAARVMEAVPGLALVLQGPALGVGTHVVAMDAAAQAP
jgi:hypothetical protein